MQNSSRASKIVSTHALSSLASVGHSQILDWVNLIVKFDLAGSYNYQHNITPSKRHVYTRPPNYRSITQEYFHVYSEKTSDSGSIWGLAPKSSPISGS